MQSTSTLRVSPGRQLQQSVVAFFGHQLCLGPGRARHLRTLARLQLDVVHRGAGVNVLRKGRALPTRMSAFRTALPTFASHRELNRADDNASRRRRSSAARYAPSGWGRIDGRDGCGNPELVALEIDDAQLAPVTAATMPPCQVAGIPASSRCAAWVLAAGVACRLVVRSSLTVDVA